MDAALGSGCERLTQWCKSMKKNKKTKKSLCMETMSNKKRRWELRLGSKVDSLTLRFQTTKLFFFDSVPNFHLRHWHRLNSSVCVCEVGIDQTLSILNVKSKQCMRVCLLSTSVLVLVCKHVHASVLTIRPQKFKDPSWLRYSFKMRCCERFLGWIQLLFFLPFIWFHCAAVKEVNKSCLQRQNSQREKEKDNLISSRLTRLSCHRLSGKDLRIENRKESDASELFSLSLTVSHFHDGL